MKANALILVVGEGSPELDSALEDLGSRCPVRVVRVERPATACARIGGGGVDAVLVHTASFGKSAIESFAMLRRAGPGRKFRSWRFATPAMS
ncbi:hypothetical protein SBA6_900010 [Candidatus Sulfopaludibacter sp. SbA6]|nr:hypothetical protein SBA6_900010 [Candidatus Sulfopaludibacter sp. SbA6]